jgi:hypothetical protein
MVVSSPLRFATGVCVLTAGLLIGAAGGAVAVADPDSTGSAAPGDDGTNALGPGSITANSPVGNVTDNVTDTVRKTIPGATSTLGSGRQPGQQPSTGATSPNNQPRGTDTQDETNSPAQVSRASDPGPDVAVPNPVAAVPNVVAPVADVVAPVADVVEPVPNVVAPVPNVVAPVSDVIAVVPDMPTSVPSAAVPLTQPPSDLSSFLLDIAGVAPVDGRGGTDGGGLGAAAGASVASQLPLVPPVAGIPGVPLAGDATGFATLLRTTFEPTGVGRASSPPGMAPLEPDAGIPMGLHSFLRDAYAKLLLPVSLWALFTVALPGVAGLVVLTAIGMRVGYRQAKAGFVVRAAGITRLARPGQLGVVNSGALSAGSLLDKVA